MLVWMNLVDITINTFLLVFIHVIFSKLENSQIFNRFVIFKYLSRIFHYPLILFLSIYLISHPDNIIVKYLGTDVLFYIVKIKMFSEYFCLLLCILNAIQIIYEIILNKNHDIKKNDRIYAFKVVLNILKIILIIILTVIILCIFDIKPISLLLTVGTPLTLLSLLLKNTIEDILLGIYLMISGSYKKNDYIYIQDKNIEGSIHSFGFKFIEIKTLNNNIIYLRNSSFVDSVIINKTNINNVNISFSIRIKYTNLNIVNEIINSIQKYITNSESYYDNIIFKLKEITSNIINLDINIPIYLEEKCNENIITKELEYVNKITELVNNKECTVECVYNFTR